MGGKRTERMLGYTRRITSLNELHSRSSARADAEMNQAYECHSVDAVRSLSLTQKVLRRRGSTWVMS